MATLAPDSDEAKQIDASLREWRQGDLALEESWFVHVGDGAAPLSKAAEQAESGVQALTSEVLGLVVVTQTCDIVRSCVERPYIEVAPLLKDWLKLVPATGRFTAVEGQVATLQEMTAEDYVDSDPLDLDHLSAAENE